MVRLGNRTYRPGKNLELPKYFLNLHPDCVIKAQTKSERDKILANYQHFSIKDVILSLKTYRWQLGL